MHCLFFCSTNIQCQLSQRTRICFSVMDALSPRICHAGMRMFSAKHETGHTKSQQMHAQSLDESS